MKTTTRKHDGKETRRMAQVADLHGDPANARKHSPRNLEAIKGSLLEYGQQKPVVVDDTGKVIAGNGTLEAAKVAGIEELWVVVTDLDQIKQIGYAIADNRTAELAEWDEETLGAMLETLRDHPDANMDATGFDAAAAEEIFKALNPTDVTEDEVPDAPETPVTKLGDLWLLGDHRVLCADATDAGCVDAAMDGRTASVVFADPPYGMALDADFSKIPGTEKSPNALGYKYDAVIGDDVQFDRAAIHVSAKDEFWWGADYYRETLPSGGSWSVWIKRGEPDADMVGNDIELLWSKRAHKRRAYWHRWVGWAATERGEKRTHPTQKPIGLYMRILEEFSSVGAIVVDPFLGSGTTLIAAEQLGRTCYGLELDPRYVDVIVRRWETLTGKSATLDSSGETFDKTAETRLGAASGAD